MQTSNQWCWEGAEPKGLPEEKCPSQGMLLQLHQSQPTVGLVHILMGGEFVSTTLPCFAFPPTCCLQPPLLQKVTLLSVLEPGLSSVLNHEL